MEWIHSLETLRDRYFSQDGGGYVSTGVCGLGSIRYIFLYMANNRKLSSSELNG